jgi:predicted MPP superfamily phosphohydrolase
MRLAHVSDLHFGHHDPKVAATLAADLAAQSPDLVVVSGDLTQRGTPEEFELARAFLDSLAAPVFAVPGNHDLGRNLVRASSIPTASIAATSRPTSSPSSSSPAPRRPSRWPIATGRTARSTAASSATSTAPLPRRRPMRSASSSRTTH